MGREPIQSSPWQTKLICYFDSILKLVNNGKTVELDLYQVLCPPGLHSPLINKEQKSETLIYMTLACPGPLEELQSVLHKPWWLFFTSDSRPPSRASGRIAIWTVFMQLPLSLAASWHFCFPKHSEHEVVPQNRKLVKLQSAIRKSQWQKDRKCRISPQASSQEVLSWPHLLLPLAQPWHHDRTCPAGVSHMNLRP